jgi:hypothetical protein
MAPEQPPSRASLGRQLVVLSLAAGLLLGGAVAAVVAWAGGTPGARAITDSVADSRREGDWFAEARRDALAEDLARLGGVLDVSGQREPASVDDEGTRVVGLSVSMSSDATAAEVARVLDATHESSLVRPRDHFLKVWPDVVVTLETGNVICSFVRGTAAQAQALVGLRDDPRLSSVRITLTPAEHPASGAGTVRVRARADVGAVREAWAEPLAVAFPGVEAWTFG